MTIDNNTDLKQFVSYVPDTGFDNWGCTHFNDDGKVCENVGLAKGVVPVRKLGEEYTGEAVCFEHGSQFFLMAVGLL